MLNNVKTKLTAAVGTGDTTINVTAGEGAQFALATGGNTIRATLVKVSGFKEIAWEVVDITARSTDALTVVRARDGTTALTFAIGDSVEVRATAGLLSDINGQNYLYNANFEEWQSYTGAVTTNAYLADGWQVQSGGNTHSATQGVVTDGTDDVFFDPSGGASGAQYFSVIDVTSVAAAGNYSYLFQRIEDVRRLAGKTITVSFWAKAASGTPLIGCSPYHLFGTGGSPSAPVLAANGQSVTLSTSWTKYSLTFTLSGISGKTLGTTPNTSATTLYLWLDAGSTYNTPSGTIGQASKIVSIAQVKVEEGNVTTPFVADSKGDNLAKCQRYYYKVFPNVNAAQLVPSAYMFSTTVAHGTVQFPVTMRVAPTALVQSGTATDYQVLHGATTTACSAVPTFNAATTDYAKTNFTVASGLTVGQAGIIIDAAASSAGYLAWSARF